MPIETTCQGCGQRLRVADEHAGKKARCPNCQSINSVPAVATSERADPYAPQPLRETYSPTANSPAAPVAVAESSPVVGGEMWTLKIDDGRTFGPVNRTELDKWFAEGRITPACQLQIDRDNRWRSAGEIYSSLGVPAGGAPLGGVRAGSGNPFSDRETQSPVFARAWTQPHNGVLVLVLGIVSCMVCALLGPVVIYLGHAALSEIKAGRMAPDGHGLVMAGTVLGWIGTAQLILGLGFFGCILMAGS